MASRVGTVVFYLGSVYSLLLANNATSARGSSILQGCVKRQEDIRTEQVNTVDDYDSNTESMLISAVNSEDQDWAETVDFGNVKEVFKLDTGADPV